MGVRLFQIFIVFCIIGQYNAFGSTSTSFSPYEKLPNRSQQFVKFRPQFKFVRKNTTA